MDGPIEVNTMKPLEAPGLRQAPPSYMIFVVVFLFFVTGLLGFLICHLLKKKGYRCRTDMDEEEEEELGANTQEEHEDDQDTVERILKSIIENEANMEAFSEMLGNRNVCVHHDPRSRKDSIVGLPAHHHTVHSGMELNSCHLCTEGRSKKGRRHSRTPRLRQRPGEQTVFSVGRFRVTHSDKKTVSGEHLDQLPESGGRKESVYNLRSMFKDVRPPAENLNAPQTGGKRKKSLTVFGLRRGSDPGAAKAPEVSATGTPDTQAPVHTENTETSTSDV